MNHQIFFATPPDRPLKQKRYDPDTLLVDNSGRKRRAFVRRKDSLDLLNTICNAPEDEKK